MSSSIGLAATLSLNTGPFVRELEGAKRSYRQTIRAIEKEEGVGFMTLRRGMGAGVGDVQSALRYQQMQARAGTPFEDDYTKSVRTMSAAEARRAAGDISLAKQAQGLERAGKAFLAVNASIALIGAATKAMRKDWDGVGDAIGQLPFGIGAMTNNVRELKADLTGAREELERLDATAKSLDVVFKNQRVVLDAVRESHRDSARFIADIRNEIEGMGKTGLAAAIFGVNTQGSKQMQSVNDEIDNQIKALKQLKQEQIVAANAIPSSLSIKVGERVIGAGKGGVFKENIMQNQVNPAYVAAQKAVEQTTQKIAELEQDRSQRLGALRQRDDAARLDAIRKFNRDEMAAVSSTETDIIRMQLEMQGKSNEAKVFAILEGGRLAAQAEEEAGRFRAAAAIRARAVVEAQLEQQNQSIEARKDARQKAIDALREKLGAAQQAAASVSAQRLPLLTAFGNPNVYATGSQQREQGTKAVLDAIKKEMEEQTRLMREDKSVRVGNN